MKPLGGRTQQTTTAETITDLARNQKEVKIQNAYQTSMTDLYSIAGSGSDGPGRRASGGPGGGSDPGKHGGVNAARSGPSSSAQQTLGSVADGAALGGFGGGLRGAFGGAIASGANL